MPSITQSLLIDTAQGGLHMADSVYGVLEDAKYVPAMRTEATLALAAIDIAVPIFKAIMDGWCKDPDVLNAAIFSVKQAVVLAEKIKATVP